MQNQYSPSFRSSEPEIDVCDELGLAFLPWSPLGGMGGAADLGDEYDAFGQVAAKHGVSPQQVALAWELARSGNVIPIPGASRPESVADSTAAVHLRLDDEDLAGPVPGLAVQAVEGQRCDRLGELGLPLTSRPGRCHSTSELTIPKSSRLTRSGARSVRSEPSSTAACTSAARRESTWRRRRQRRQLHLAVATHPEQQRDGGLVGDEHLDALPDHRPQPLVRRGGSIPSAAVIAASSPSSASSRACESRCSLLGTWW